MALAILNPIGQYFDLDGSPLDAGYMYFGVANQNPTTSPATVYWDAAETIPASQPIRTVNGYPVRFGAPAMVCSSVDVSMLVRNRRGEQVFYAADSADFGNAATALAAVADLEGRLADTTDADNGAGMVADIAPETGAVATTQRRINQEMLSFWRFLTAAQIADVKSGAMAYDLTTPFNAWLLALRQTSFGTYVTPYDNITLRGMIGHLPRGKYRLDGKVTWYEGTGIQGDGKMSSLIYTTYNGRAFEQAANAGYDGFGCYFGDFSIFGSRAATSQVGFAALRLWESTFARVGVYSCGGDAFLFRQSLDITLQACEALQNVGAGLHIAEGIDTWAGGVSNSLPSNAVCSNDGHYGFNDGAGVLFTGATNGCVIRGRSCEYNYATAGDNAGYNIEDLSSSFSPNTIESVWCEGPAEAHIYIDKPNSSEAIWIRDFRHFGLGASGATDRAMIVESGLAIIDGAYGHGTAYKTIAGSTAPFRLTKASGSIYATGLRGSLVTGDAHIEDETGATTALYNNVRSNNYGEIRGPLSHQVSSSDVGQEWKTEGDSQAWMRTTGARSLQFGSGSATPDATLARLAAGVVGASGSTLLGAGSAWDGSHLLLGVYHIWVDATGTLRIKSSAPTSDTDGTVIGI